MNGPIDLYIEFWLHFWPIAAFFLVAQVADSTISGVQRLRGRS